LSTVLVNPKWTYLYTLLLSILFSPVPTYSDVVLVKTVVVRDATTV
jgi:hypothetical protein